VNEPGTAGSGLGRAGAVKTMTSAGSGEPGGGRPAAAIDRGSDLDGLADGELLAIARSGPQAGGRAAAARELLVIRYRGLVAACVARYRRSPDEAEDLMQVGYVGLMKAISHFDPAFGGTLAAYAHPTIVGELRRHFRDRRWPVHVPRPARELVLAIRAATEDLTHELGRIPSEADLAARLGVSAAELRDARLAETAFRPLWLDAPRHDPVGAGHLADNLGDEDRQIEHLLAIRSVAAHWAELPPREQAILTLRFHGGLTQVEIGRRVGLSQMQVSRLISHALGYLRSRLLS
jgi:RNA polymerase sigma-B factor